MPNTYRVEGDVAFLRLDRRDDSFIETMVSMLDLQKILNSGLRWSATRNPTCRAFRVAASRREGGRQKTVQLSRFILDASQGLEVDHINNNPLDNRRENLRLVTRSQNEQNKPGARSDSGTGVRGVFWHKHKQKYRVRIWRQGKGISVGYFDLLAEAEVAAIAARRKHFTHSPESRADHPQQAS